MKASNGVNLRTGMAFLLNEFYNLSVYRVSFWLTILYTFLMMYSVGYVWRALYAANPSVTGVSLPQMISYAVIGVALESILHPRNGPQSYIMEQVRKGTIEMDLLKPIDFQFYMFAKNMGRLLVRFLFLVLPSFFAAYLLFSLELPALPEFHPWAAQYGHHEHQEHQLGIQCGAPFLFRSDGAPVDLPWHTESHQ